MLNSPTRKMGVSLLSFLLVLYCKAQDSTAVAGQPVQMADTMRSNGKIFVVVAVLGTILIGLLFYLVSMDRKLRRLEKEIKE